MPRLSILFAVCLILAACGSSPETTSNDQIISLPAGTSWPHTIEGMLEVDVEEGGVGEDGLSDVNFGAVVTADGTVMVEVSSSALRVAGIRREDYAGTPILATLSGPSPYSPADQPMYRINRLARAD